MRDLGHDEVLRRLEERLGPAFARRRVAMESDPRLREKGRANDFAPSPQFNSAALRLSRLYERGRSSAAHVRLGRNEILSRTPPSTFDGFTVLHPSDLPCDTNFVAMHNLARLIADLDDDLCVMTGDYRGPPHGSFVSRLDAFRPVREAIRTKICALPIDAWATLRGGAAAGAVAHLRRNVGYDAGCRLTQASKASSASCAIFGSA